MGMRGIARTIMEQMVGMMEQVWFALTLRLAWLWKTITAFGIDLKTHIVVFIRYVVIQWSIDRLHVLKLTLLALLIRCGLTIVSLVHTAIGSLHRITVRQLQRLAMKQASLERTFAQKDMTGQ
jgi:hypothetical protein